MVVAGAWERDGIRGYHGLSGDQLWERNDLHEVQKLTPSEGGSLVAACFDQGTFHCLDAGSGETTAELRGVRSFYPSAFGHLALTWTDGRLTLLDTAAWKHAWRAEVAGFGLLDATFAPAAVAASDVVEGGTGSIYCFDLAGQSLWQLRNPPETNARSVAWDPSSTHWVAVLHHVNHERPDTLVRISVDGVVLDEKPLGLLGTFGFLPGGGHLVSGTGQVLDTESAEVVWDLPL